MCLKDRHGEGHLLPTMDQSQDYKLISGFEKDGKTTLKFSRKLDTCDKDDLKIEVNHCERGRGNESGRVGWRGGGG